METKILISGFGGQGMMSLGKIMAEAALKEKKHTSWFPSYGAEMRGGTAHCFIKISSRVIASPFIESPDIAIIFNQPSLDKFAKVFEENTLVVLNSDLIHNRQLPAKVKNISCPLNRIALSCGNIKVANTAALGAVLSLKKGLLNKKTVKSVLEKVFCNRKVFKQNLDALSKGEKLC